MLLAGFSCPQRETTQVHETVGQSGITLFFTGDELGALRPCGCSGGQLGGLERRPAVFNAVPSARRMIVETGALVGGDGLQDLIKFRIFLEAFASIGYDLMHLTAQDAAVSQRLGLSQNGDRSYAVIAARWLAGPAERPPSFSKEFTVDGRSIAVIVASVDAKTDPVEKASQFWAAKSSPTVKVLILQNSSEDSLDEWVGKSGADCIVIPSKTDEPQVLSPPKTRPVVFSTGRFGRHVSRLDVAFSPQNQAIEMQLRDIPVEEKLPNDEALVRLYKQYQMLVKDSHLLEAYPRVPLPNYLRYVGAMSCESCHLYQYTQWSAQPHASAFATLEKVGSDYDPECVVCHVIGMEREGGFVTPERTPQFRNVGCEVCHGPGSEHLRAGGHVVTTEPKTACVQCHTPEHSGGYAGHEAEYMKKIVHSLEP